MQHFDYQAPECIILDVMPESVLCTSSADQQDGSYIDPFDKVDGSWE